MRGCADAPAHDLARGGVDNEGNINEPLPCGDIGEVRNPQHVRRWHPKLAVHLVKRTGLPLIGDRRPVRLSSDNALTIHVLHQPRDSAADDIEPLAAQLVPDLGHAVDAPVLLEYTPDLGAHLLIPVRTIRPPGRSGPLRQMIIGGGWGDLQHLADRPSPSGSNRWRLDGSAPYASRCASMKPTITSTGGRAPPSQNTLTRCAGSRSPGAALGSRAPAPSSFRPSRPGCRGV